MTLTERVMSIVGDYESAGGCRQANVVDEISRGGDWEPSEYTDELVRDAIWDLIQTGRVRLDHAKKLRLPIAGEVKTSKAGRGPSGILPLGPGDTLFNVDGEPMATVVSFDFNQFGRLAALEVAPTEELVSSRFFSGAEGTQMLNVYGQVIGATKAKQCLMDHGQLQERLVRGDITGSCPDCGCHLWTKRKEPLSERW